MNDPSLPKAGFFVSDTHAAEHLCDHVLTRPETHDWALVLAGFKDFVKPMTDDRLLELAASFFPGPPSSEATALLSQYVVETRRAIEDALRFGFWWESCQGRYRKWMGLGLDGVFVVWDEKVIQTGYFPASAAYPVSNPPPRTENPLPRRRANKKSLRTPPPANPPLRYRLFCESHHFVSRMYAAAYYRKEISQAGGEIFKGPPRIKKWEQWLADRPQEANACEEIP